ncbi:MAG TPA: sulfatase [Candidatus Binatia bacterium]|jgi:arylsulfatase A-like enzyme
MAPRVPAFLRCLGALLLLTATTWVVEIAAFVVLWRTQTLAPYAFFPNQAYDFLAKIRWFGDGFLKWAPALPDRFAGLGAGDKLSMLSALLPSTLVVALIAGTLGGLLCAALPRRRGSLRRDVVVWALVALAVHLAATIPAMNLDEGIRVGKMAFRARSLVIDGMVLATVVSVVAGAIAWAIAPMVARSRALSGAGLAAMALAAGAAVTAHPALPPPQPAAAVHAAAGAVHRNVILISLDSLRADHVGAFGYKRDTTPSFDRFTKESVLFTNAIASSSWTLPTHMTMFTGRSQLAHGVVVDTLVLPRAVPTLGEIFHDAGYATAGFVSGPYVNGHYGYDRGMDTYVDLSASIKGADARSAVLSPAVNEKGIAWIDQTSSDRPFFLFLHYFDIHYDYVPPPPYDKMFDPDYTGTVDGRRFIERPDINPQMPKRDLDHVIALYDGEIRFTDEHVGLVLDHLKQKGLLDNTLVMIVADHGDEFFEHGNKGHHRTVYDEVLHVPFAIRLPGGEHAGEKIETQASTLDVFPTLLDAAGLAPPPEAEGESLIGWIRGEKPRRDAVYSDFYDKRGFNLQVSRRTLQTKTIQHFNRITHPSKGPFEYYDLARDAGEQHDEARQSRAQIATAAELMTGWLNERWRAHRAAETLSGGSSSIELDAETKQRLKSLGYVGN